MAVFTSHIEICFRYLSVQDIDCSDIAVISLYDHMWVRGQSSSWVIDLYSGEHLFSQAGVMTKSQIGVPSAFTPLQSFFLLVSVSENLQQ